MMFNARQLMIFYFYGTCNQKATIIQFQKLKEKAKTEETKNDIQDLIDFVAEYEDPDNYRWFFWESWLDIDMHRTEDENSFIDAMKSRLEDMAMEIVMKPNDPNNIVKTSDKS